MSRSSSRPAVPPIRTRRVLVRIYVAGGMLVALIWLVLVGVGRLVISPAINASVPPLASWVVPRVAEARRDAERLQAAVAEVKTKLNLDVTLYDASGRLLASNVDPPLPALRPDALARLEGVEALALDDDTPVVAAGFRDGERLAGYGLVVRPPRGLWLRTSNWAFAGVLVVLAFGAIPLARSIVGPLERLAAATRAFGQGDLAARVGSYRRDEIGDVARAFDEMADRVALLLRTEKELLANVSHELKTPLARIRVVLDLASEDDPARAQRYLREIAEDLAELERLVEDVLTAARLDLAEGRVGEAAPPMRLEAVASHEIVERAAAKFRERHPQRTLAVETKGPLPWIDADAALLRRAVDNLLENAHKYSNQDDPIALVTKGDAKELVIEVRDRGIGIPAEELERVFQPFYRSDQSRARKTGGVGLGLALARRIVEAHRGTITLESEVGVGTTARIVVPAREAAGAGAETDARSEPAARSEADTPPRLEHEPGDLAAARKAAPVAARD